jgi:hypothetical protein
MNPTVKSKMKSKTYKSCTSAFVPRSGRQDFCSVECKSQATSKSAVHRAMGYELLVVWESDYNKYPQKVIQECIDFLSK